MPTTTTPTWCRKRLGRTNHSIVRSKSGGFRPKCGRCTSGHRIAWDPETDSKKRCPYCLEIEAVAAGKKAPRPVRKHVIHGYIPKGGGALRDIFMLEEADHHAGMKEFMRGDTHLLQDPTPGCRHVRITIEEVPAK